MTGSLAAGIRVDGGELFVNGGTINAPVESVATVSFAGMPVVDTLTVSGGTVNVGTAQVNVNTALTFTGTPAILSFVVESAGNGSFVGAAPEFTATTVLNISVNKTARVAVGDTFVFFNDAATGDVIDGALADNLVSFTKVSKGTYAVSRSVSAEDFALAGGVSANAARAIGAFTSDSFANERLEAFSNLVMNTARHQTPRQVAALVESVMPDSEAGVQKTAMESAKSLLQTVSHRVSAVSGAAKTAPSPKKKTFRERKIPSGKKAALCSKRKGARAAMPLRRSAYGEKVCITIPVRTEPLTDIPRGLSSVWTGRLTTIC